MITNDEQLTLGQAISLVDSGFKHHFGAIATLNFARWIQKHQNCQRMHKAVFVAHGELPEFLGERVTKTPHGDVRMTDLHLASTAALGESDVQTVEILSPDKKHLDAMCEKLKALQPKRSDRIYVAVQRHGSLSTEPLKQEITQPLEWENYAPEIRASLEFMLDELGGKEPSGRLTMLSGPPGTGKTHLLKALPNLVDATILLLPASLVGRLDDPSGIALLSGFAKAHEGKPVVIIVEDGDQCVAPRGADNISDICSLLNLSDGILGASLDLRFVVTTNAEAYEIEDALSRPGRLSQHIRIGKLDVETARDVWMRLTGKSLDANGCPQKAMTLAEVYTSTKPNRYKEQKKKSVGFGCAA